jgi:hypothetical protein
MAGSSIASENILGASNIQTPPRACTACEPLSFVLSFSEVIEMALINYITLLLLFTIALLSSNVEAFWRMRCSKIQMGRVDPIVTPGKAASHSHVLVGSSSELW